MILFNLLPIFPLDGYRLIFDLFNKNLYVEEVIIYFGILIEVFSLIIFYIFNIYGFIFIFLYLFFLSLSKIRQINLKKKVINYQMKYELSKYLNKV